MAGQGAAVPVFEHPAGGQDQGIFLVRQFGAGDVFQRVELARARVGRSRKQEGRAGVLSSQTGVCRPTFSMRG